MAHAAATTGSQPPAWVPLDKLRKQFDANLRALERRDPPLSAVVASHVPTNEYYIAPQADCILLGRRATPSGIVEPLANPLPPASARQIVGRMFPKGVYTEAVLVAGLDQGWLWDALYKLEPAGLVAPGMKPPLYCLAADVERLWAVMHYQNWAAMLADPRVQIFAGRDAVGRLRATLSASPRLCPPRMSVTVEATLWPEGQTFDSLCAPCRRRPRPASPPPATRSTPPTSGSTPRRSRGSCGRARCGCWALPAGSPRSSSTQCATGWRPSPPRGTRPAC